MFYLVVIAYLVPFISCLLLFVSCSWPCAMLWAGPNWTGRAQCLQSGCCSLSLSPVFYPQVAMSWSWLTAAASHLRAAVGSELAMISKWWGKHLPESQVQQRLDGPFVSIDSCWSRQENIPGSPHCTCPGPGTSQNSRSKMEKQKQSHWCYCVRPRGLSNN